MKKNDYNGLIGTVLLLLIFLWYFSNNPEKDLIEKINYQNNTTEITDSVSLKKESSVSLVNENKSITKMENTFLKQNFILKNEKLTLEITNLGAKITSLFLNNEKNYKNNNVVIIDNENYDLGISFHFKDSLINTNNLPFKVISNKNNTLKLAYYFNSSQFITVTYNLPETGYMISYFIKSTGLEQDFNIDKPFTLNWKLKSIRQSKGVSYENRYTKLVYAYDKEEFDNINGNSDSWSTDKEEDIKWIAYKQHFFTSVVIPEIPFKNSNLSIKNLVSKKDDNKVIKTKSFKSSSILNIKRSQELNEAFKLYFGPTDFKILESYNPSLTEIVPLGWGIFGKVNRYIFIPLFNFLSSFLPYGLAIILMTLIVKLVMSPITYKSYVSQAKMRVLKPEITEINKKYAKDNMAKQQEIMKLYNQSGVSPLSGCIPALLQIPVFYALFNFFPSAYELRQKGFLWVDDLSAYDSIYKLSFKIPFYGDHISLLPLLASIAIFIYMRMTTGNNFDQPQQPGVPNMKFMIYLSPIMMLFFFNNYASGLSLYYFISNLLTIFIMLAIKKYIVDEEKIQKMIEEKRANPQKQGNRFQRRMQELMDKAEQAKKRM